MLQKPLFLSCFCDMGVETILQACKQKFLLSPGNMILMNDGTKFPEIPSLSPDKKYPKEPISLKYFTLHFGHFLQTFV